MSGIPLAAAVRVLPVVDVELRYAETVSVGEYSARGAGTVNSNVPSSVVSKFQLCVPSCSAHQTTSYVPDSQYSGIGSWNSDVQHGL